MDKYTVCLIKLEYMGMCVCHWRASARQIQCERTEKVLRVTRTQKYVLRNGGNEVLM